MSESTKTQDGQLKHTSSTRKSDAYTADPIIGNTNPPIRGTAPSALNNEERSHVRGPSPTIADRSQFPRKGDPGKKETGQAL